MLYHKNSCNECHFNCTMSMHIIIMYLLYGILRHFHIVSSSSAFAVFPGVCFFACLLIVLEILLMIRFLYDKTLIVNCKKIKPKNPKKKSNSFSSNIQNKYTLTNTTIISFLIVEIGKWKWKVCLIVIQTYRAAYFLFSFLGLDYISYTFCFVVFQRYVALNYTKITTHSIKTHLCTRKQIQ